MKQEEKKIWKDLVTTTLTFNEFKILPDSEKESLKKCFNLYENDEDVECFRILRSLSENAQKIFAGLNINYRWRWEEAT